MDPQPQVEVLIRDAQRVLERAHNAEECVHARELAVAARRYAQSRAAAAELLGRSACLVIEAEQKLGMALAETGLAKGAPGNQYSRKNLDRSSSLTGPKYLRDLKIPKNVSSRSQLLAKISCNELRKWLVDQCEQGKEPTLRAAEQHAKAFVARSQSPAQNLSGNAARARPLSTGSPLTDLLEHQKTLDRLLRKMYEGGTVTFTQAQGRLVKRYLSEIGQLSREIGALLRKQK